MANIEAQGNIRKMRTTHSQPVQYSLPIGDQSVEMNELVGQIVQLSYSGVINCINCGRKTKKSFSQGYCYPCFNTLPECDPCIIRPELCDPEFGTLRDKQWGKDNLMQPHIVYLANSSGLKVGITRETQVPTRWMDQGASWALPIIKTRTRLISGLIEVMFKDYISDRTDWRRLLKGSPEYLDLSEIAEDLVGKVANEIQASEQIAAADAQLLDFSDVYQFDYPVSRYPEKIKAHNFDKTAQVSGLLEGIKGQYLIFDNGVLNVRKFAGYEISLSTLT